eukprot:12178311-Karenia_brevis.AAC.1
MSWRSNRRAGRSRSSSQPKEQLWACKSCGFQHNKVHWQRCKGCSSRWAEEQPQPKAQQFVDPRFTRMSSTPASEVSSGSGSSGGNQLPNKDEEKLKLALK